MIKLLETCLIKGAAWAILKYKDGRTEKLFLGSNMITDSGENLLAKRLGGIAVDPIGYIAIGTDSTSPAETDTSLIAEVGRKGMDSGYPSVSGSSVTFRSTWTTLEPVGQPYTLRELGLFNAATGGVMLNRIIFDPISKTSEIELIVVVKITFE